MTTEHTGTPRPSDAELARIAAELRALGEPEFDAELEATPVASLVRELAVPTAFALAFGPTDSALPAGAADPAGAGGLLDVAPLTELDRARVWRKIVARRSGGAAQHHGPRAPSWRATWVAVATAAGLALVPVLSTPDRAATPAGRAAAEALGSQARAALEGVPGEQDGGRAAELAAQYSARLSSSGSEAPR
ncbi:MAG: hypothetical protein JNK45_12150 [Myxococcales bacterium]|nr:hypothetical protein [Myxococcales bacterium]